MGERKVPVTVISGFLGSGKTTLLRRLLSDPSLPRKLAVLVNDLGELGLDHEIIASESDTPTLRVTELTSGCVCCTLRSELGEALVSLARGDGLKQPPEHILIEPSGIARASEVSFAVNALSFDAPVECDAVVTVIDLHTAERAHREHPDARLHPARDRLTHGHLPAATAAPPRAPPPPRRDRPGRSVPGPWSARDGTRGTTGATMGS